MSGNGNVDPTYAIGVLGTRVTNIEQQLTNISTQLTAQIASLSSKIDERSKTQWPTLAAFTTALVVVIGGLASFGFRPIDASITRLDTETAMLRTMSVPRPETQAKWDEFQRSILKNADEIDSLKMSALTKGEFEASRLANRQDNAAKFAEITARMANIEAQARQAADAVVPRGEHQERWRSQDAGQNALQRQIDELKTALGGIYGARDVILELRERLDRIDRHKDPQPG
jgi:hypothetical protein